MYPRAAYKLIGSSMAAMIDSNSTTGCVCLLILIGDTGAGYLKAHKFGAPKIWSPKNWLRNFS